jgi:mannose-1-phosphate guanylyltransferase/mannose-6-phosphate isomerase
MTGNGSDCGTIWPVLLAGGTGTRLWPMSRSGLPKQFMALASDKTMLQEAALRVSGNAFNPPLILCNDEHRFIVAEQFREASIQAEAIILEPIGRNTAPAAAIAALILVERDPDAIMLLSPADHVILDTQGFHDTIQLALPAAQAGRLVTFGITPDQPETGYGYIQKSDPISDAAGCFAIAQFTEKPDAKTAQAFVTSGDYFWNSGIFLMGASAFLGELERLQPDLLKSARAALALAEHDIDFLRLNQNALETCPNISIDYAVMEKTALGAVVPATIGWSDVGSWSALWQLDQGDTAGNVTHGDVLMEDTQNSYLRTEKGLLATIGIENMIVIVTDDAVLVAKKDAAQDVKKIVEQLKATNRPEPKTHTTVYRPWGSYHGVDIGDRFQVKRITVNPGGRLSLQKHAKRAEHWVVVSGRATVTRDDETLELGADQSTYIPIGMTHRLENKTDQPLHLIEIQSGDYLGEDDIVRLEDVYGRD